MADTDEQDFLDRKLDAERALEDYADQRTLPVGAFSGSDRPRVYALRNDAVWKLRVLADWIEQKGAL